MLWAQKALDLEPLNIAVTRALHEEAPPGLPEKRGRIGPVGRDLDPNHLTTDGVLESYERVRVHE